MVKEDDNTGFVFDEKEAGVGLQEYEITFEDDSISGGVNLMFMFDYYNLGQLIEKINW